MTTVDGAVLSNAREPEVQVALQVMRRAIADDGVITAATETQIHNALHGLRSASPYSDALASLEAAAASLRVIAEAHRTGRCNLQMSQRLRLRKQLAVEVLH
jgi:hypothetical protein